MTQERHRETDTRKIPKFAVIYTHFPHYRAPVFAEMSLSGSYNFTFFYDPLGVERTILSGTATSHHVALRTRRIGPFFWQGGALSLALSGTIDGFIFLGNPNILSTWLAAALARIQKKPVLYWTHGWIREEAGLKATARRAFYSLANVLLVYGNNARNIGIRQGYPDERIAVINNSLDYESQAKVRSKILATPGSHEHPDIPNDRYFLSVTRLVTGVRLDMAIEAMAFLPSDTILIVVGDGPERERLETRASDLGIQVRFLGAIYDEERLARLFLNACAVVSPGKIGLLALHALAYGVPVITHGDMSKQMPEVEAIEDGVTGAFFRYDDVSDLARVMQKFLATEPDAPDMEARRNSAISTIEANYTPAAQVRLITSALDVLMKGRV